MNEMESLVVDCDRCIVRSPSACADCVVTALLGEPGVNPTLDVEEQAALEVLAGSGLVAPLRLVVPVNGPDPHADENTCGQRHKGVV